jgi:hypothetical protein
VFSGVQSRRSKLESKKQTAHYPSMRGYSAGSNPLFVIILLVHLNSAVAPLHGQVHNQVQQTALATHWNACGSCCEASGVQCLNSIHKKQHHYHEQVMGGLYGQEMLLSRTVFVKMSGTFRTYVSARTEFMLEIGVPNDDERGVEPKTFIRIQVHGGG